mgnify:CR=1 FL=1
MNSCVYRVKPKRCAVNYHALCPSSCLPPQQANSLNPFLLLLGQQQVAANVALGVYQSCEKTTKSCQKERVEMALLCSPTSPFVHTQLRSSEPKTKLASPLTVAGRVRPTQLRSCASLPLCSVPVVERLHVREAQNSIVPAPTFGNLRPIEEVGKT